MPQFAVLIHATGSDRDAAADPADREPANRHAEELAASGAMVAAYAFAPPAEAVSVRSSGVTDGPFAAGPASVIGFYILEATDLDSAVAVAGTNPAVRRAGGGVEVRAIESGGVVGR